MVFAHLFNRRLTFFKTTCGLDICGIIGGKGGIGGENTTVRALHFCDLYVRIQSGIPESMFLGGYYVRYVRLWQGSCRVKEKARAYAGGAWFRAEYNRAGGIKVGKRGFPNLKIPHQNPRLHYFQTIQFWR